MSKSCEIAETSDIFKPLKYATSLFLRKKNMTTTK